MRVPSTSSGVMVGRDADLEGLRAVFADVESGLPRIALIAGEAGIGKSRLVAEFLTGVEGRALVLAGQCVDFAGTAVPFAPIATVLRDLVETEGADEVLAAAGGGRDALAGLLDAATADARRDAYGPARLHEGVARLLERFSAGRPLVVVIEDLHWGDRETLDLLRFVSRVVTEGALLTILTYRTDDVPRGHPLRSFLADLERNRRVSRFELSRLSVDEVREQARQLLGHAPAATQLAALHERSEGVPFFVEELLSRRPEDGSPGVPDTLRHALLLRYESLDESAQRLVRLLAAAGSRVEHDVLLVVSDRTEEELERDLRVAVDAGLVVVDGGGYAFRHALVREAVDAELLPGERRAFHARYARALSGHPDRPEFAGQAVLVSSHSLAAHDLEGAFAASITALRLSEGALAYTSAATMGERALELWDRVPDPAGTAEQDRVELLSRTARAWKNAGDDRRALPTVDLALQEAGRSDPERYARLLRLKATITVMSTRSGVIALLEEALGLVPPGRNPRLRTSILAELAAQYMVIGSAGRAIERATEALEEGTEENASRYLSIAANVRGCSRIHTLDIDGGHRDLDLALRLAGTDTSALLRYHVNASDAFYLLGDFTRSVETAREGLVRAREAGVERSTGSILGVNAVDPLFALGDWDRADELIDRSLDLDPPQVFKVFLRRAKMRSVHWRGDPDAAWELYQGWRTSFVELGALEPQIREGAALDAGEIALSRGDLATAWHCAEELLSGKPFASPGYELPLAAMAARALARRREEAHGDPSHLASDESRIRAVLAAADRWPTAAFWSTVVDAELSGEAGTGDDPEAWRQAVDASAGFGVPALSQAYVRYGRGVACLSAGDRAGAGEALGEAQARAATLGAGLLSRWSRDLLQVAGLANSAPSGGELTARERQVLDLIADGLSNAEIGRRLFISGKTVSVHVSAILRKLGATSRTDAARISRLRG